MEKTSMQILSTYIDEMQDRYIALAKADKKNKELQTGVDAILTATTLIKIQINNGGLEKEKEQIIDSYYGNIDGVYGYREAGEKYYNEKYKINKNENIRK